MQIVSHPENLENYKLYISIISHIRKFLESKNYLELDLPVLSPTLIPESYLEIFETTFVYLDQKEKLYLTPSPELFIKRLLSDGIGDCFYMGKSFRNSEPNSPKHQPEFTMLELYKVGETYRFMAEEILRLLSFLSQKLYGKNYIYYKDIKVTFDKWEEYTIAEVFQKYAGISEQELFDESKFIKKAKQKGYKTQGFSYEDIWSQIYAQEIEPKLGTNGNPTVLFDYPMQFAALCQPNKDGKTAQRFEFYIGGVELGNCYSELTDSKIQEIRFKKEDLERKKSGKISYSADWDFIKMLEKGLPKSTGIAVGVDRLCMVMAGVENINDLKLINLT